MIKRFFTLFIGITVIFSLVGCDRIDTGQLGIAKGRITGKIEKNVYKDGVHFTPLTKMLAVDGTEVRIEYENITPKDRNNIKFEDVDLTIAFKINPEKAVPFYIQTKEVDKVKQNDSVTNVLGYRKVKNKLKSVIIKAFACFSYTEFMTDRAALESKIRELAQIAVNEIKEDTFIIGPVDTTTINLDKSVEKALQDKAIIKMKKKLTIDRQELILKEMETQRLFLLKMKDNAKNVGIPLKDLMNFSIQKERNSVLSELAKGNNNVQVQLKDKP